MGCAAVACAGRRSYGLFLDAQASNAGFSSCAGRDPYLHPENCGAQLRCARGLAHSWRRRPDRGGVFGHCIRSALVARHGGQTPRRQMERAQYRSHRPPGPRCGHPLQRRCALSRNKAPTPGNWRAADGSFPDRHPGAGNAPAGTGAGQAARSPAFQRLAGGHHPDRATADRAGVRQGPRVP